jgi:preprotein translocase SecE subunit
VADKKDPVKKRQLKKPETIRERAAKADISRKPRRIKRVGKTAVRPIKAIVRTARKEVYLPMPDTRAGRFLNKRRRIFPRYFGLAFKELRQVKWPGRRETARLTFAVSLFALFLMLLISLADFGLDKLFEKLILK